MGVAKPATYSINAGDEGTGHPDGRAGQKGSVGMLL